METLENRDLLAVTLAVTPDSIAESGPATAAVVATLSEAQPLDVVVDLELSGTAVPANDYSITTSQIVIPAGSISGTSTITPLPDARHEGPETIVIAIASVTNDEADGTQAQTLTLADDDPPPNVTVSLNDGRISENGGVATLTAGLSAVSGLPVTIDLVYSGTATAGADFFAPQQLVIAAGSLIQTLPITTLQDELDEANETIVATAATIQNGSLVGGRQFTSTIIDDDSPPTVSLEIDRSVVFERNGFANLTASLSQRSGRDVVLDLEFSGAATFGADFTAPPQIVIPAGAPSASATLAAIDDVVPEPSEVIFVGIASSAGAIQFSPQQVAATILDDDIVPSVTLAVDSQSVSEDGGGTVLRASLDAPVGRDTVVDLEFAGAAERGVDYVTATQILVPAGATSGIATINALADEIDEVDEFIQAEISAINGVPVGSVPPVFLTVIDDDLPPSVSLRLDSQTISEAGGAARLTAELSAPSSFDVIVALSYTGSARRGSDYAVTNPQVIIPAGSLSGQATITTRQDIVFEGDETVQVTIIATANAQVLAPDTLAITVTDDDLPPEVQVELDRTALSEMGGATTATVSLSNPSVEPVAVTLAFGGTASPSQDFTVSASEIVIPAGSLTGTSIISAIDDAVDEANETVLVTVTQATGASIGSPRQAAATIIDDDEAPSVTLGVNRASIPEQSGIAILEVSLSEVSAQDVTVQLAFTGTATRGSDYFVDATELVIEAGAESASTTLNAIADAFDELSESIVVDIVSVANADEFGEQQVLVAVEDDDPVPGVTLSVTNPVISEVSGTAVITATLSAPSRLNATVVLELSGTATLATDYDISWTQIVIAAGQVSGTATLQSREDVFVEATESIIVSTAAATNAVPAGGPVQVQILDDGVQRGTLSGRVFHDRDADGSRTPAEEYVVGWTVRLLDSWGDVIAEQQTRDVDLDGNDTIDEATERGWYEFGVAAGQYTIETIPRTGWKQTAPTDRLGALAFELSRELDFVAPAGYFEDWGGQGERWLQSTTNQRWYYLLPDGMLFQWDDQSGAPLGTDLNGELIAEFDPSFHAQPAKLLDALPPQGRYQLEVAAGEEVEALNFAYVQLASIEGRKFHDRNSNGLHDDSEEFLNGWTIELLDDQGAIVAVQQTSPVDLNGDGDIDPLTESGWYGFDGLDPGQYTIREVAQLGWRRTTPANAIAQLAFIVDQQFDFFTTGNLWENFGGSGEKWLQSGAEDGRWFYVTADGGVWRWDRVSGTGLGTPLAGELVATLDTAYHVDPILLVDAQPDPGTHTVDLTPGERVTDRSFGSVRLPSVPVPPGQVLNGLADGDERHWQPDRAAEHSLPELRAWQIRDTYPARVDRVFADVGRDLVSDDVEVLLDALPVNLLP